LTPKVKNNLKGSGQPTIEKYTGSGEVAEYLGVPRGTVNSWRSRGQMPKPYVVLVAGPIWKTEEIASWWALSTKRPRDWQRKMTSQILSSA